MKKKLSFALIAILVVILVMSTVLVACKKKDENGNEVTLTSIKLETSSLTVDSDITVDSLKSQIKVVAVYSDGSETAITDFEISGFDPTVVGTAQTVTVTYQGQTYTMTVTVNAGDTPIVTPTFSATVGENAITFEQAEGAANVFVAKVTLTKGQEIVLKDADGNPIALGGFNGIADIDGEYVITVTVGETLSVKVDVPQAPVVVETSYVAKVGDKETAFVKDDASGIYTATVALKVGDVLEVYDNEGAKLAFADPNNFNGTAAIEGDYELTVAPTAAVVRVVVPQAPEEEYGFYAQVNGGVRKADFVEGAEGVYSLVIELNVGENVEVKDTDGKLISFSENFDGNVTVAGEYKFEILPTALIVNVTLPEVQPEKTVYFVIYGNDKAELVYNEDQTDYDEYYAILVLEEGDFFVINDNKGNRYVNYENEGFNGTAPVAGEYEVYLKLYEGGAKVYVVIPEVQPEKTVYYVSYGNDKAELVRNEAQTDYEEYAVKVTLEEGVTISVLDNKGGVYSNYENEFNGTATISGEYAVYLKLYEGGAKVYVVVPVVEEAKYFIEINEGDAQAFVKNGDKEEYMFSATLAVGDKVVIRDVTGAPIESYENSNVFSGTAKVEGDYVFYVKVGEKVTVYTEAPSSDAKATIYYYNSNSWNVVNAYAWEGSNEYLGAFPGVAMNAIADEPDWYFVEISVNAVNVIFSGVAGEQTDNLVIDFDKPYFKDGVWYAEKPSDVQPNETVYTLTSGDKTVVLAKDNEGQFVGVIELEADAVVAIADNKGNVYDNYEKDCGFNGTATIEGRYTFYLKINDAGYTIWVTVPEQEDETIVLYYYNEYSWNGVNAYAWSFPDDGVAIEYLGSYPGKPMSAIADEPGWYSVEVSVNATNVKFSGFGDGEETGDLAISARTPYYKEGSWYAEKPEEEVNDYVFAIFVDDEFAVAMEYENGEFGEQYVGSAELTDDDTIKIVDAEGNPYDNYQTEGFDGTAAFGNGTYTFYLKINDENKIYVDFEAFDEIEYEYAIFVNDDYYADLDYSEGEFGSEYVGSVSVEEGDFIAIFDAKGNNVARNGFSYKEVNDGEMQFNGTVSANGTFYFWLKENEQTVWFAFEEAAEEDSVLLYFFNDYGLDAIYAYAWTDGEQVGDAPTEYLGKFPGTAMEETDVEGWLVIKVSLKAANIIFSDGTGNQDAQTDDLIIDATTPYFYDGEWYEEMPDIGEDETTYSIYVDGEYKTTMIKYEFGEDDEDNKYYGAVTVEAGAVIVIMDELGEVYNNYVDETFNGTAAAAGLYELSMGFGEDHPITVEFTEATEPEYEYAIFVNGEFVKGLNWVINEFEQEQFENSVSVEEGDEIVIKDAEGNDVIVDLEFVYVTVEGDVDFEGTAFAEGTYSFYLKEGEKKIYWTYAEPEVEDETINVYFYNKDGWDSVYAYAWSGSDEEGDKVEYLGVWNEEVSGTEMLVTDFDGWFVVEVSAKASYVIFNNGNGEQTDNLELNSERPFFYNGEWYEEMPGFEDEYEYAIFINGEFFGALTEIDGVYRVGVLLNEGDEVSIKDLDEVEYNNFQGEFNGVAGATGFYDFYMSAREGNPITVEFSDVVEEYDYAVFVNGEKAATLILAESDFGEQYEGSAFALMGDEIVIKDAEGNDVSTDLGYEFINGEAEEVFEGIAFADGTYYFYLKESELTVYWSFAEPEVEDETINVYFYNKDGWDSVYAYAWSGSDEEGDKVEYL
ncbi:MAG: starch-binding protein, partial [Clostridia bacterium]|nr:starch-binding protein [Clostridia bacterium]